MSNVLVAYPSGECDATPAETHVRSFVAHFQVTSTQPPLNRALCRFHDEPEMDSGVWYRVEGEVIRRATQMFAEKQRKGCHEETVSAAICELLRIPILAHRIEHFV
jgi:hypothetical protein